MTSAFWRSTWLRRIPLSAVRSPHAAHHWVSWPRPEGQKPATQHPEETTDVLLTSNIEFKLFYGEALICNNALHQIANRYDAYQASFI